MSISSASSIASEHFPSNQVPLFIYVAGVRDQIVRKQEDAKIEIMRIKRSHSITSNSPYEILENNKNVKFDALKIKIEENKFESFMQKSPFEIISPLREENVRERLNSNEPSIKHEKINKKLRKIVSTDQNIERSQQDLLPATIGTKRPRFKSYIHHGKTINPLYQK